MPESGKITIFVVDDDEPLLEMNTEILHNAGYEVRPFSDPRKAVAAFAELPCDLVFTDVQMSWLGGIELLRKIKEMNAHTPVIVASAFGTIKNAVQAMKDGAFDFLTKPIEPEHLVELVKRALEFKNLARENVILRAEVADLRSTRIAPMGSSPVMKEFLKKALAVADTDATVLLIGESGVGKEILADYIQRHSPRKNESYVKVNCGAFAGTLLESELFGHEKGAFTGATEQRRGRFELAHKGTLFLDEIGELTLEAQTRLLRALQQREVQRVGSSTTISLDIRVICATNKDLKAEVAAKRFRDDLYYRIYVFPLRLPSLRQRVADIPGLAFDLLRTVRTRLGRGPTDISQAALDKLSAYHWPGNIRELENVLERCSILCAKPALETDDLPEEIVAESSDILATPTFADTPAPATEAQTTRSGVSLEDTRRKSERERIVVALQESRWNISTTAKLLGISRSTLYVKLDEYGINKIK
ncbi:MAG: sigma-54 dependent transcriptional regulator [Planctomycetota bacterium]